MPPTIVLKIPLLMGLALGTYRGMTPPTRPPRPDEMKRATVPDFMARKMGIQVAALGAAKTIFCTFALAEAATLAVTHFFPPESHVRTTLSTLLPLGVSLQLTPLSVVGCALGALGGFVRVWCHRTLGRLFTWNVALLDDHKLVTTGPYSIVRHPSYAGWYMIIVGNILVFISGGSFQRATGMYKTAVGIALAAYPVVVMGWYSLVALGRTKTEDLMLKKEFGPQWEEWAKKTPYRLIPFVY